MGHSPSASRTRAVTALVSALALASITTACGEKEDPNLIRLNGRLEAPLVDVAPKVTGRVVEVLVREGDRVKAGDLLIRLDLGELEVAVARDRAGVESAEAEVQDRKAAVDLATRELQRQEYLLSRKVGTERDVDRAKTDLERAQAGLKAARNRAELAREGFRKYQTQQARDEVTRAKAQLRQSQTVASESEIRAPADAIVLHRMAEPGLLLAAGQPGLTLAFANRLYVRTFIPETQLGRVKQGQTAQVSVDAFPGRTFSAKLTEISRDAEFTPKQVETRNERINLVYGAKVDLDAGWKEPLVPGQPAEVVVNAAQPAGAGGTSTQ